MATASAMTSRFPGHAQAPVRQGAVWLAVVLSYSVVVPQDGKSWYGGTQVTTRQATGPPHLIWVLHWP